MTINVNVWWVVVVGAAVALYFAAKVLRAAAERFMARIEALTQVFASVSVQLGELSKRLEGAENIGGYLAGLQRVAEAQVAAATKLAVSVEAFEGIVFAPPTTSGSDVLLSLRSMNRRRRRRLWSISRSSFRGTRE